MKILADFSQISRLEVGDKVFEELCSLTPESILPGSPGPVLNVRLYTTDPRYLKVRELFQSNGFTPFLQRPKPRGPRRPNEYWLIFRKEYERSDYEKAPLLEPVPLNEARFPDWIHSDVELLVGINGDSVANRSAMAAEIGALPGAVHELILTSGLKHQMENAGLKHLVFRELPLLIDKKSVPWPNGSHWALRSDITLPPAISNSTQEWDAPRPPELRYRRSDIAELPEFDLAQTHDKYAGLGALVASQQFYRFLTAHGLRLDWIPVYIEQ